MSKTNAKLQEIIDFFELEQGWDRGELISDILHEIKGLKGYAADEIGLEWDGENLMVLDDFVQDFFTILISKVCNVIKSFQNE